MKSAFARDLISRSKKEVLNIFRTQMSIKNVNNEIEIKSNLAFKPLFSTFY